MLFINAALSKNQLYKHKNQTNEVLTIISKQDDIELFSKYFCTSFYSSRQYLEFIFMLS